MNNVSDLLNAVFTPPASTSATERADHKPSNARDTECLNETIRKIENITVTDEVHRKTVSTQTGDVNYEDLDKTTNLLQYENSKQMKYSKQLSQKIQDQNENLNEIQNRIGHYSVRNVNKRDETAKKNLHALRDTQRLALKQERQLKVTTEKLKTAEQQSKKLSIDTKALSDEVTSLSNEVEILKQQISSEKSKKLSAQKYNSHLRNELRSLRVKFKNTNSETKTEQTENDRKCNNCETLLARLSKKENEVIELEELGNMLKSEKLTTKNEDGSYSDKVRLCIVELSGLEVAVEKVSEVIKTVSKHLFHVDIENSDLPSSSTVQSIVDEGHYLAKTYISHQLSETENWGLSRDGTTRRKQKILDTSVTLSSGGIMSLGFNRVAHETAVAINEVTKSHLHELADLHSSVDHDGTSAESYIVNSLEKLAFTMSDRASNEKKADRLLDEWRDQVLQQNIENPSKVHHFHCMAHVLLGFHNYICADLKAQQSSLVAEHGLLGRDNLSVFKFWSKKGTVVERALRTTSDVFGPSGDHHGVRDIWEAHCAKNGLKSVIGNYKDNRFNALFQTSAEIYLHREDFITVLETINAPNLKLQSVLADLQSDTIMTVVQCLGLFYLKLTGPYWNLLVGNNVPYLELHKEVQVLHQFLTKCEINPATILHEIPFSEIDTNKVPYQELLLKKLENISENPVYRELLNVTIKLVSGAMKRTVEKQLVDFLNEGQYSQEATEKELQRTNFAHVTNLGCEHHFGDLDSSQRRRPHASLHHHSSVQLLKRNRSPMMHWLTEMPESDRQKLLKSARKGGKLLRQKHQDSDKNVLNEINSDILLNKKKKENKKRKADLNLKNSEKNGRYEYEDNETYSDTEEEARLLEILPTNQTVSENDYVAIAYQDAWYPGIVVKVKDNENFVVKFMTPTRKPGCFSWPSREDIQIVEKGFVLSTGFIPDCMNSGRMWKIKEANSIDSVFKKYSSVFF
ncbi:uncharacterized protein LOC123552927 [Mercenaria mercenaria]|uniref:uncharacterized protein LOC123552927 n=1 Tax=Mercenaria mercenaria TaxID=6596 RepID=UPI00234E59D7|nr:uncharacterized protein LOC123552927 [Mercenaria mercenaria]